MKDLLKKLAEEQRALKAARKTGPYTVTWKGGYAWDDKAIPENILKSWHAASKVRDNALYITVALNLYHEKRGSDYRHNIPGHLKYQADKLVIEINNLINALAKV